MRFIKVEIIKHIYNRANTPFAFGEAAKDVLAAMRAEGEKDPREKMKVIVEGVLKDDLEAEKKCQKEAQKTQD